jgi:hypothetical protein
MNESQKPGCIENGYIEEAVKENCAGGKNNDPMN